MSPLQIQPIQFNSRRNEQTGLWGNDFTVKRMVFNTSSFSGWTGAISQSIYTCFQSLIFQMYIRSQLYVHSNTGTYIKVYNFESSCFVGSNCTDSNDAFHQILNRLKQMFSTLFNGGQEAVVVEWHYYQSSGCFIVVCQHIVAKNRHRYNQANQLR